VRVEWRRAGEAAWHEGPPLLRVERGAHFNSKGRSSVAVPPDAWLFAGSTVLLAVDTEYALQLTLTDPDGGGHQTVMNARTRAEPAVAGGATVKHLAPGNGGGAGTADDPIRGLAAAQATAQPGDLFLLHAGTYAGTFDVRRSGAPGRPVIWRGPDDGEAIIDAQGDSDKRPSVAVVATGVHDVWFERLTIRNAQWGIAANEAASIVVRRCRIHGVDYGITGTRNDPDTVRGWFIADNIIEGTSTWPRTKGIESARGIQLSGEGHDVCYNRLRGFADAINTFPSPRCAGIDFHHNEISEMTDDGIEMDGSERNVRCFRNRLTNVFHGISVQPVHGGPVYVFRNALYNVAAAPFKMHNSPSGALFYHNTSVKRGMPLAVSTHEKVRHCVTRNNLFIGTEAGYAFEMGAPAEACDFDYDGFGGGPWKLFLKWNGARYATLEEVLEKAPVYRHAARVGSRSVFSSGATPPADETTSAAAADLRLAPGTAAVDAGEPLPGFNDGFSGKAPDLGAYEAGTPLPPFGPRPDPSR
jgi:Right handed beta helix region